MITVPARKQFVVLNSLLLAVTALFVANANGADALAPQPGRKIYIRNHSDRPIRMYFLQEDTRKGFCVLRIRELQAALVENVPSGNWGATVIELLNGRSIGNPVPDIQLTPGK